MTKITILIVLAFSLIPFASAWAQKHGFHTIDGQTECFLETPDGKPIGTLKNKNLPHVCYLERHQEISYGFHLVEGQYNCFVESFDGRPVGKLKDKELPHICYLKSKQDLKYGFHEVNGRTDCYPETLDGKPVGGFDDKVLPHICFKQLNIDVIYGFQEINGQTECFKVTPDGKPIGGLEGRQMPNVCYDYLKKVMAKLAKDECAKKAQTGESLEESDQCNSHVNDHPRGNSKVRWYNPFTWFESNSSGATPQ